MYSENIFFSFVCVYVCVSSTSYGIMYMLNNLKITVATFLIKDDVNMGNLFMFTWGIAGQMVLPWFEIDCYMHLPQQSHSMFLRWTCLIKHGIATIDE